MKKTAFALVVIGIVAIPAILRAGSVSGHFKAAKKGEITPTAVAAFPVRQHTDPLKKVTAVVLAEGMMDAEAALQSLDPHTALINQEGMQGKNYISLYVEPDGFVGMNATFSEGMVQYLDSTKGKVSILAQALVAELTENSPDRVAGRIYTSKPVTTAGGDTYELDVKFDTSVTRPASGKDLGKTGGQPGKALEDLMAAIKNKDWKALQTSVKSSQLENLVDPEASDEENFESVVDSISMFLPKGKARVVGGEQIGDAAVLELEGEMMEGDAESKALYLIRMVQEEQSWRFDRARLAGFL